MKYEIVGQEKEIQKLDEILASKKTEFLALGSTFRLSQ